MQNGRKAGGQVQQPRQHADSAGQPHHSSRRGMYLHLCRSLAAAAALLKLEHAPLEVLAGSVEVADGGEGALLQVVPARAGKRGWAQRAGQPGAPLVPRWLARTGSSACCTECSCVSSPSF